MTAEVIHGDCLEVLQSGRLAGVHALISDPPYGINYKTSASRSNATVAYNWKPIHGDDKPFDPAPWLAFPVVALSGANNFASRLPDHPRWLIWDKREGGTPDDSADCEIFWTNQRGPSRLFHHKWRGMIKASEKNQRRVHPTQKPVALMRWVIEQLRLPPGALICDPYCGSGTTGIAAQELGFPFIGIEREASYVDVARKRLADARSQLALGVA